MWLANIDGLGTAFLAFGLLMCLTILAGIMLLWHVARTLQRSSSAAPSAWRQLALGWWGTAVLGLCDVLLVALQLPRAGGLAWLALLAAVLVPTAMALLATWSGSHAFPAGCASEVTQAAGRRVQRLNLGVLGLLLVGGLFSAGLAAWQREQSRLANERALQAETERTQQAYDALERQVQGLQKAAEAAEPAAKPSEHRAQ